MISKMRMTSVQALVTGFITASVAQAAGEFNNTGKGIAFKEVEPLLDDDDNYTNSFLVTMHSGATFQVTINEIEKLIEEEGLHV